MLRRLLVREIPWPLYAISGLLLLLGVGGAWYVRQLYDDLSRALELNAASVRAAEELEISLREIRTVVYRSQLDETHEDGNLASLLMLTDRWMTEVSRLATTPEEQAIVKRLKKGYQRFLAALEKNQERPQSAESNRKSDAQIDNILTREIILPAHEYLDYNENVMLSTVKEHRVSSSRISLMLLFVAICGSLGGFAAGVAAFRRTRRTMVDMNVSLSMTTHRLNEVVGPIELAPNLNMQELRHVLDAIAIEVERVVTRLQRSQQEVLRSEKLAAIGQLAAGTAHEIRNPLMSIKLLVQSGLEKGRGGIKEDDLLMIEQEICRLEKTVQTLLDFSKPPKIFPRRISIARLIDYCLMLVRGRAEIQKVKIRSLSQAHDLEVLGDFQQLQQVLLNILLNSLDASPQGAAITVTWANEPALGRVRLEVQDTGRGIPENLLPQIFEPFFSSKDAGTGLGLSISKQIVEAHGGEIFARNQVNSGAIVGFFLPTFGHFELGRP